MSSLILTAPLSGWAMPLEEVPDAAFAERMVGDGAAIDPTDSILRAPCDGRITMIADARHALTLRAGNGAEILLHVGIDTVGLRGDGLIAKVEQGQDVRRGDPLLDIDLDRLAQHAKSLVTPVLVTDARKFSVAVKAGNRLIGAGEPFLEIGSKEQAGDDVRSLLSQPDATGDVTVYLEHGFHARPAARIARCSRQHRSRIVVSAHGRDADAGSTVSLMALGVRFGDRVALRAFGADAAQAVRALTEEISSGLGESPVRMRQPARSTRAPARVVETACHADAGDIRGTVASRGLAVGVALQFEQPDIPVTEHGGGVDVEMAELERARDTVKNRLREIAGGRDNDILGAQMEFLGDPGLLDDAEAAIRGGKSAAYAWRSAIRAAQDLLRDTGDTRLAERIADLSDVETQVLQSLTNETEIAQAEIPDATVILATELFPSQLSRLDLSRVAGFCSAAGGPTSHVALLAASMGIPAVVGAGPSILKIANGTPVLLDAEQGRLEVEPDEDKIAKVRDAIADRRARHARHLEDAGADCYTADGCRIEVFANLASSAEAEMAVESGAEGCGLLRTEFLFQNRTAAPSEDEQAAEYQAIADALGGRSLVIRTLDAGGDKPIAYLPLPPEENPLLGLRGLRATLRFPDLLREQLAAILRVHPASQCRILLPMITEPREIRTVRKIVDALASERQLQARVALGAMIETPASVVLVDAIAREADFLSIGTNDLAQYTLAMDRTHPELARTFDFFHPAVLRQIAAVCNAAESPGRSVSVCGALASDLQAAPVLLGLGVRTLSAVPNVIPELKALIRKLSLASCRDLARAALAQDSAPGLRRLADEFASAGREK
ncbi:MAG: phosphoenolpyruvate--protein phosphotransferase [Woeseia sp.]